MISAILVFSLRGEVLSSRIYKDGLRRAITDVFRVQVISNPDVKAPLLTLGSTSFLHVRHEDVYVVAVTRHDVDAALVYELLYKIVELGTTYFGAFNEAALTKNITLMYELLDELIDFGYPQNTDKDTLRQFITAPSPQISVGPVSLLRSKSTVATDGITAQATSTKSWRRPNIKYRRNEVFLDVLEKVNAVFTPSGDVSHCDVHGQIMIKSHLSGMPECHIGLNDHNSDVNHERLHDDRIMSLRSDKTAYLEDFQLHQCVELSKFQRSHVINFVPPDGEFELMKYRVVKDIKLPFGISVRVTERDQTRVEYEIALTATFESKLTASNVVVNIPVPPNSAKTRSKAPNGKVKYNAGSSQFEWRVGRMSGGTTSHFTAEVDLMPTRQSVPWSRPPITLDFSLDMFSSSGLVVRYLRVQEKLNYSTMKWVRYLVQAGSYEVRIN